MSQPISICAVYKAAMGDEKAYTWLRDALVRNIKHGAFTTFPCECKPACREPSMSQIEALDTRLVADLSKARKKHECRT